MHYQDTARKELIESGFMYWKDALLGEKHRGSRVRVIPVRSMLAECGYCKKVTVLGKSEDVFFDEAYVDYYKDKTGIDYKKLWNGEEGIPFKRSDRFAIAQNVLYDFLKESNITLDPKVVRHSLTVKFQNYLEAQNHD